MVKLTDFGTKSVISTFADDPFGTSIVPFPLKMNHLVSSK